MSNPFKRKRVSLPIEKKLEIIHRIENGESRAALSRIYNIGKATIYDIMNKKDSLLKFVSELDDCDIKKRKTMKNPNDTKLENAVYLWYMQKKSIGEPVTGPLLCEKALEINEQLGGSPDFKASSGWLHNFKSRHGIKGNESSMDASAVELFKTEFQESLNLGCYCKDNIYNVDEFSINWNSLPHKQYNSYSHEIFTPTVKTQQERLTVMVCSNSCGSHKLPLLVVGDPKYSECFKDIDNVPVTYVSKKSCLLDPEIFTEWYSNTFIPNVKRLHSNAGKSGRILLLLDNAQCHPYSEALNTIDQNFSVFFIPLHVASYIQPVSQGISDEIKQTYRKQIANFITTCNDECINNVKKCMTMKEAIYILNESWNSVSNQTIKEAWFKLWQNIKTVEDKIKSEYSDESFVISNNFQESASSDHKFFQFNESNEENETQKQFLSNNYQLSINNNQTNIEFNKVFIVDNNLSSNSVNKKLLDQTGNNFTMKRKHVSLPIETKLEIINRIENGESRAVLSRLYNIGKTTITDIMNKKEMFIKFISKLDDCEVKKRKSMKNANDTKLEDALHLWYLQKKSIGEPVNGPLLCEKALELNVKLGGSPDFKASSGWLYNFKLRHGIRGHESSLDFSAIELFKMKFNQYISFYGYSKDNVYNVDEFIINWRSLPQRSQFSTIQDISASDIIKLDKERLTVMLCSNATGTHKFPLFITTDLDSAHELFKSNTNLPIIPNNQKTSIIDTEIFSNWYTNNFIKNVKTKHASDNSNGKVLLLFDNERYQPLLENLNKLDENFRALFIPLNVSPFLQPMNQGIIDKLKELYRKRIMDIILSNKYEEDLEEFLNKFKIRDSFNLLSKKWNDISEEMITSSWHKLWKTNNNNNNMTGNDTLTDKDIENAAKLFFSDKISGFPNIDDGGITVPDFQNDTPEQNYKFLNENFIESGVNNNNNSIDEESSDNSTETHSNNIFSHSEAFLAINKIIDWYGKQPEYDSEKIVTLNELKNLASLKMDLNL